MLTTHFPTVLYITARPKEKSAENMSQEKSPENNTEVAAINLIKQRNSAFAAVLKKAEIAGPPAAATPVEVRKRPLPHDIPVVEDSKRPRLEKNETFVMRLPASAQSGLCQQRAKETLDQQRKLSDKPKPKFK